jgi:UDP-glucose 4-epimerase
MARLAERRLARGGRAGAEPPLRLADVLGAGFDARLRERAPRAVLHLGLGLELSSRSPRGREEGELAAMAALLAACARARVERVAVLSSSCVYGARAEGPDFADEGAAVFADGQPACLRGAIAAEALAVEFARRFDSPRVCVLRAVPALGALAGSWLARYLVQRRAIAPLGFDPMLQVLHEDDLLRALQLCVERGLRGVYNAAGAGEVPLSVAIAEAGGRRLALPEPLAARLLPRWSGLPSCATPFLKYPWRVSGERFVAATGFSPLFGLRETLRSVRGQL